MQDYRKLIVWQKAHRLTLDVYADAAKDLAHRPAWALRGQLHGAAIFGAVEYRGRVRPGQQFGLPAFLLLLLGFGQRT